LPKAELFKKFVEGVIGSLGIIFANFLVNLFKKSYEVNFKLNTGNQILEILTDNKFWLMSIGVIILIIIILPLITNIIINKKQDEFSRIFSIPIHPGGYQSQYKKNIIYSGLEWIVHYSNENRLNSENIEIDNVYGPFCKNDKRNMKETRTYFGRFKYKCPKCHYKKMLLKNSYTLENEVKDELKSEYR